MIRGKGQSPFDTSCLIIFYLLPPGKRCAAFCCSVLTEAIAKAIIGRMRFCGGTNAQFAAGFALAEACTNETHDFMPPPGAVIHEPWRKRGAHKRGMGDRLQFSCGISEGGI